LSAVNSPAQQPSTVTTDSLDVQREVLAGDSPDCPTVVREILDGLGLSFSAARKVIPPGRNDKLANPSTFWRWARHGVSATDGTIVKLEVARVGCRWATSRPALERFLARLNANPEPEAPQAPPSAAKGKRAREVASAQAELGRLGI
jgi:hypothetical protein